MAAERAGAITLLAAESEEGAQVCRAKGRDVLDRSGAANMSGEKAQELPGVAFIGLQRVFGKTSLFAEAGQPGAALGHQIVGCEDQQFVHARFLYIS